MSSYAAINDNDGALGRRNLYLSTSSIILASIVFLGMSVCIIESSSFPSFQQIFARQLAGLIYSIIYLRWTGQSILGPPGIRVLQLFNGAIITVAVAAYMIAVSMIPLSDAISLTFVGPVFVSLTSFLVLKEKLNVQNVLTIIFCMIGVLMISRPTFLGFEPSEDYADDKSGGSDRALGIIIALIGASMQGPNWLLVRKMSGSGGSDSSSANCDPFVFVFYMCLVSVVFSGVASGIYESDAWTSAADPHSSSQWLALFGIGLTGFVGQSLTHYSLKIAPPGAVTEISNLRYLEMLLAFVYSAAAEDDVVVMSIVGAVFISLTTIYQLLKSMFTYFFF